MSEDAAQALAVRIATRLGQVTGVAAVALGGSRARGTATATSDIDLGIYYEPETPLDVDALRALARGLDGRPDAGATAPGEWGPWINGGAWLVVEGVRVDWLYRDLARVRAVIADCRAGHITSDYQVGHPHGFHNHMYLAETIVCRPLHDPTGALAALKAAATPYPEPLRAAIIRRFLWEAGFSLEGGAKGVPRLDVTYVAGCLYRTAACLLQVLFALNREPFLNEKGGSAGRNRRYRGGDARAARTDGGAAPRRGSPRRAARARGSAARDANCSATLSSAASSRSRNAGAIRLVLGCLLDWVNRLTIAVSHGASCQCVRAATAAHACIAQAGGWRRTPPCPGGRA